MSGRARRLLPGRARVECPCCGGRFRAFEPYASEQNVECRGCGSHGRHRLLWLFFDGEGKELISGRVRMLHFAPEECLAARFRTLPNLSYLTADLRRPAMEHFDIADIPHPDGSFDVVLCSHVLEHVDDDRAAMRELYRVLRPGGSAIVLVPLDSSLPATREDPTVETPEGRERVFGQYDHVRQYGLDFPERLEAAGFRITVDQYVRTLDIQVVERYACNSEGMWVCVKDPRAPGRP